MIKEETNIIQLLTSKPDLEQVTIDELQQLVTTHPYFAAAQLLLAKKMQAISHEGLQSQLQKTALFFPNEQWLRYLLSDDNVKKNDNTELQHPLKTEGFLPDYVDTEQQQPDVEIEEVIIAAEKKETFALNQPDANKRATSENEEKIPIEVPVEEEPEQVSDLQNINDEPEIMPLDEEEMLQQSEPLPLKESSQKIAGILQEQAEVFHKPFKENEQLQVAAEPYHTVDYFASQGFKLDKQKQDGLGKKVHKFTDWLRQMKRINPQPVDLGTDAETESFIENIAATSNQTKDVITESMAEVLVKQDKNDKAVEIYQKLSLLYPAKTAYFAAKIEHLKSK